jgi:hypothetical protein
VSTPRANKWAIFFAFLVAPPLTANQHQTEICVMPEQELQIDRAKKMLPLPFALPLLTAAQKQFEAFAQAQTELTRKATEINGYWADRGQSEVKLSSESASKLATAHSIPDAMTAWQEWDSQRFEIMAEDGKHLVADIREVVKSGAGLLPNGGVWTGGPAGPGS